MQSHRILEDRVALVTGAGRGNGAAIAVGLAAHGAAVIVTDVDLANAQRTASTIAARGGRALAAHLDVANLGQCSEVARTCVTAFGPISILVNNAGILTREGVDHPDLFPQWRRAMSVNLDGVLNMSIAFLPHLKETRGAIVNIASIAAYRAIKGSIGYSSSKAAVKMLTRTLAAELANVGVRVNAIAPGFFDTPLTEHLIKDPERSARVLASVPMGRFGQPEELIEPVIFLSSPKSAYITGATLPVDGGYLAT